MADGFDFSRLFGKRSSPLKAPAAGDQPPKTLLPLRELALRQLTLACRDYCVEATLEECRTAASSLASWPPETFKWLLPRLNHRLLLACRTCGLPLGSDEEDSIGSRRLRSTATAAVIDAAIRREEHEYRDRRTDPEDRATADADARTFPLLDVFGEWHQLIAFSEEPSLAPSQLLFASHTARWNHARNAASPMPRGGPLLGTRVLEPSLERFEANFEVFTSGALRGLNWDGLVAAGGAVLACCQHTPADTWPEDEVDDRRIDYFAPPTGDNATHERFRRGSGRRHTYGKSRGAKPSQVSPFATSSDVDLFLVGCTPEEGVAKLHHVHAILKRNLTTRVLCVVTESAVTFTCGYPVRQVQVVLRRFASPTDVLSSFDVDCCAFAFDGKRVYATARACRAVMSATNTVDLARRSQTYESRLLKYARRGFAIGLDATIYRPRDLNASAGEETMITLACQSREPWGQHHLRSPWGLGRLLLAERRLLAREHSGGVPGNPRAALEEKGPPVMLYAALEQRLFARSHGELPEEGRVFWSGNFLREVAGDEMYNCLEAEIPNQRSGTSETPPALYTAGPIPWRLGFDALRVESFLNEARAAGQQYQPYDETGRVPDSGFTLTQQRSSTLPSEHVRTWGYQLSKLVAPSHLVRAATCISFFPRTAVGFDDGVHYPPGHVPAQTVFSLTYRPPPSEIGGAWLRVGNFVLCPDARPGHNPNGPGNTYAQIGDVLREGRPNYSRLGTIISVSQGGRWDPKKLTVRRLDSADGDAPLVGSANFFKRPLILLHVLHKLADERVVPPALCRQGSALDGDSYWGDAVKWIGRGLVLRQELPPSMAEKARKVIEELAHDPDLLRMGIDPSSLLTLTERPNLYASQERVVAAFVEVDAGPHEGVGAERGGVRVRLALKALASPEKAWGVDSKGSTAAATGFRVGEEALLHGLVKAAGFNGLRCTIIGGVEKGDRYPVQICQAGIVKSMLVRIENLAHADALPSAEVA